MPFVAKGRGSCDAEVAASFQVSCAARRKFELKRRALARSKRQLGGSHFHWRGQALHLCLRACCNSTTLLLRSLMVCITSSGTSSRSLQEFPSTMRTPFPWPTRRRGFELVDPFKTPPLEFLYLGSDTRASTRAALRNVGWVYLQVRRCWRPESRTRGLGRGGGGWHPRAGAV